MGTCVLGGGGEGEVTFLSEKKFTFLTSNETAIIPKVVLLKAVVSLPES